MYFGTVNDIADYLIPILNAVTVQGYGTMHVPSWVSSAVSVRSGMIHQRCIGSNSFKLTT